MSDLERQLAATTDEELRAELESAGVDSTQPAPAAMEDLPRRVKLSTRPLPQPAERPTPITDAHFSPVAGSRYATGRTPKFCRDLERQLAEAREKIDRQAERIRYLEGATNHATGTPLSKAREERDRLAKALRDCKEDSVELLAERSWWQDEIRGDYQRRYAETKQNIIRANKALDALDGTGKP